MVHIFITCLHIDISSWLLEKTNCWGCGQRSLWTQCNLARLTRINPELPLVATLWNSGECCSWLLESASYTFMLVPFCPMLTQTIGTCHPSIPFLRWLSHLSLMVSSRNSVLCCKLKPTLFPDFENFLTAVCLSSCLLTPLSKSRAQRNQK